ncbi:MAG TPA: hypothetical protein VGQ83_02965 [Polyangia bacterium]|jgi:hypothetical protein
MQRVSVTLTRGGPFLSLLKATRLLRGDGSNRARPTLALVALTWLPLLLLAPFSPGAGLLLTDFAVHTRLLVAIPLLLSAEGTLHALCSDAIDDFAQARLDEGLAPGIIEGVVRRADRWWSSAAAELLCLLIALLLGQLNLWRGGAGLFTMHETLHRPISAVTLWYAVIALPAANFLFLRCVWRWLVWSQLLWRFSRLEMRLVATHPDLCGGLATLAIPCHGLAPVLVAFGASLAGSWGSQIVYLGAKLASFQRPIVVLAVLAVVIGLGPLAFFSGALYRVKLSGRIQYGALARAYTAQFHERWIVQGDRAELLGTPDLQSLADLANSFSVVRQMRLVPLERREALALVAAILLPMFPLLLTEIPLRQLVTKLAGAFF